MRDRVANRTVAVRGRGLLSPARMNPQQLATAMWKPLISGQASASVQAAAR